MTTKFVWPKGWIDEPVLSDDQSKVYKAARFRRLWKETGFDLPELAAALGRSRGTITKYSHDGASSKTPPDHILAAMDKLVLDRAQALVEARGYMLVRFEFTPSAEASDAHPAR